MDASPHIHVCRDPWYRLRVNGKLVRFSFSPWYEDGPLFRDPDGKPMKRQPGPKSAIYKAWQRWLSRNIRRLV